MSTTTMFPHHGVARRRFYVEGALVPLSTSLLMEAYASGSWVMLYNIADHTYVSGHIQGIRNESGSTKGRTPQQLLVSVVRSDGSGFIELYVKTTG